MGVVSSNRLIKDYSGLIWLTLLDLLGNFIKIDFDYTVGYTNDY
jgi:hypothetical protein